MVVYFCISHFYGDYAKALPFTQIVLFYWSSAFVELSFRTGYNSDFIEYS
jgi:hypothetical protein